MYCEFSRWPATGRRPSNRTKRRLRNAGLRDPEKRRLPCIASTRAFPHVVRHRDKRFEAVLDAETESTPARRFGMCRGRLCIPPGCARPRKDFDPNQIIKRTIEIE